MKIGVLISGGVDSSVALNILADRPELQLKAYYLKIWLEEELAYMGECPWQEDLEYVRAVCDQRDVPLQVVPLQREYWDRVVSYTIAALKAGQTPSPDIFCNQRVKFGAFFDHVGSEFDQVATGHYARIAEVAGRKRLLKGVDPVKDQTYFLSHLSYQQLERCLFPIGELPKSEVRDLAKKYELPNQARRDSQGICFLGKIPFNEFVKFHLGERPGKIMELETGKELGMHHGYWFHTIGQRKGLGLSQGPWFVVQKNLKKNEILVSHQDSLLKSYRDHLQVTDAHWIDQAPASDVPLSVKLRHSPTVFDCTLKPMAVAGRYEVQLSEADPGVAPGQFAIFYQGDHCLGGSVIAQ